MKQMFIMQGLPGGGKTSWAEGIKKMWEREGKTVVICSADHFYEKPCPNCESALTGGRPNADLSKCIVCKGRGAVFEFVPGQGHLAHGACFRKAIDACRIFTTDSSPKSADIVIIDNTNTLVAEVAPYMALAGAYGYVAKIERHAIPTQEAFRRNIHGVPMDTILWMNNNLDRFADEAPGFWPKVEVM